MLLEAYVNGGLVTSQTLTTSVDRTTYTISKNLQLAGYPDGSNYHSLFNGYMQLLCSALHVFLLEELSCGIGGVGFLAFSGENDDEFYCDAASNHQLGNKVLKYAYSATCEHQGYTGDYCCSYCGEIIEKGKTISALGGHKYSNSCDAECNECGFKRDAGHSYDSEYFCSICQTHAEFTVTFKNWNGTVISTKTYHYGDTVTVPTNPTRVADSTYTYAFAGWDQEVVTSCAGDATYTATYASTYIDYTVIFKDWNGTVLSTNTYHYGDTVSVPTAPTRPQDSQNSYTFKGWDKTVVKCAGNTTYTAVYTVIPHIPNTITSNKHTVSGGIISKIGVGTTAQTLLGNLSEGRFASIYQGNKAVANSALIGTGMVVKIMDGSTVKVSATVVVTGDTNGDGKINITDMLAAKAHLLNKSKLSGVYAQAADTNSDGKIHITDFIQMKAHILGKSKVEPQTVVMTAAI